jgi:hypothetical protein
MYYCQFMPAAEAAETSPSKIRQSESDPLFFFLGIREPTVLLYSAHVIQILSTFDHIPGPEPKG